MLKPSILFDIDGVLADCMGPLYAELHQRGYPLEIKDNNHYYATSEQLVSKHGLSHEMAEELMAEIFWGERFLQKQPARVDGIAGFRIIAGLAENIHIVTARNVDRGPHVIKATTDWVKRHGMGFATLAFEIDKTSYMRQHKLHYMIEDAPHTAETAFRHGFGVILVNAPYNQSVKTRERLWRVDSVNEAAELISADWASLQAKGIAR